MNFQVSYFIIIPLFFLSFFAVSQRPLTGEKIFKNKYPNEQFNLLAEASLLVSNSLEDDIIVTLRDGGGHYITHLYLTPHPLFFGLKTKPIFENVHFNRKIQFDKKILAHKQKKIYQLQYKVYD